MFILNFKYLKQFILISLISLSLVLIVVYITDITELIIPEYKYCQSKGSILHKFIFSYIFDFKSTLSFFFRLSVSDVAMPYNLTLLMIRISVFYNKFIFFIMFAILLIILVNIFIATTNNNTINMPLIMTFTFLTLLNVLFICLFSILNLPNCVLQTNYFISYNSWTLNLILIIVILFSLLIISSQPAIRKTKLNFFEYYILLLTIFLGCIILIGSTNLLISYLSLELISITSYIILLINSPSIYSIEATLKYFILGSIASIIFLFGLCNIYFITGTLNLNLISLLLSNNFPISTYYLILLNISFICFFLTFSFKFALVPFYFWIIDIFDTTKSFLIAFLTIIPKIAYLSFFLILIYKIFICILPIIQNYILVSIIISSIIGIFGALKQIRFKRLLAYSTIFHSSLLFISIFGGTNLNLWSSIFFFSIYIFTTFLIWIVLFILELSFKNKTVLNWKHLSNLINTNKSLSFIFSILILSLAGLPPFIGFFSKFFIFLFLINKSNFLFITIICGLLSIIGLIYYLKFIKLIVIEQNYINLITSKSTKINYFILSLGFISFCWLHVDFVLVLKLIDLLTNYFNFY